MELPIYRVSLEVQDSHSSVCLDMKHKETARRIDIALTDGGFPYRISEECYAVFAATKADGKRLLHHCEISNNIIRYISRPQTTAAVGMMECEIRLYGANDKLLFSPGFNILVSENAVADDDDLVSEDDVDELTHLISKAAKVIAEGKEVNAESRELIDDMEAKRETLDRQIADTKEYAESANRASANAVLARDRAEGAANLAVSNARQAETSASNAKASEDNAKASAQTAVNMANAALQEKKAAEAAAERAEAVARKVENGELDGKSAYQYAVDGGYTGTEEEFAEMLASGGVCAGSNVEPAEDDIPKVFFGGALPQTKDDTVMSFRYISKTMNISGYCKTKAQGNSSMNYPKKNQTVKLYKDADCTEKLKVDFKGWGKQNKFCFKANWIDLTHARNVVSARLWGDVVKSRANYETIPELLRTSPNLGAVDGFPIKVYAGGVYQGRYTLNIPKDAWMANMDDELNEHCILCGENYESGCFRAAAVIDESDWTDEVHDTVPDSIKTRWNEVINFVMTSTNDEFVANIGKYFDLTSLIDYYLFGLASCGLDAFGKNQLYMTYNGQTWYATMYDMDSTWGLWWDGSKFLPIDYARTDFGDYNQNNGNLLYIRLESLFRDEIKCRWEELRAGALSIDNIVNHFERFTDIAPPYLVEEDYAPTTAGGAFTAIPLQDSCNIQQIRAYAKERIAWVHAQQNNTVPYPLVSGTAVMADEGAEVADSVTVVGNHVTIHEGGGANWGTASQMWLNLTDVTKNRGAGHSPSNQYATGLPLWFSLKNGDTVTRKIRNIKADNESYSAAMNLYNTNDEETGFGGDLVFGAINGTDQEHTITITKDTDVALLGWWSSGGDQKGYTIDFDIELYVNGVRYV